MKELKTLNDLNSNQTGFYRNVDEVEVFKKRLKQEAINWVKFLETQTGGEYIDDPYCCKPTLLRWIKHFFNLTEDDLK
jgi:hypothetical protein